MMYGHRLEHKKTSTMKAVVVYSLPLHNMEGKYIVAIQGNTQVYSDAQYCLSNTLYSAGDSVSVEFVHTKNDLKYTIITND